MAGASRKRGRYYGGRDGKGFCPWPVECATHPNFYGLSAIAKALLFELLGQYRGRNNGDLTTAWSVLKHRGWRSRDTVQRAEGELLRTGWIVKTRQGGRNRCNLFALTFFDIDECGGKLDTHRVGERLSYWRLGYNPELSEQEGQAA
ncbi:hypothetical protein [Sediminicurvatus halobius]|uniref:Helix-turn-helix domain-containing protein n=1 Tax=Sediminicurvatus halobius TaxID=2182432 RepID=A0A2U2MZC3_9GAMM|nr:hypothetical protein [Spiribacter halobius]PWG62331.1 hypothetical protein DEM34_12720 [Spiribacter halobius]UEX79747.1 hypothetical protein LMH63_08905 [Spiribacter halobius]